MIIAPNATLKSNRIGLRMSMKTVIHVNQHNIKRNKGGRGLPVITVKDYKQNRKGDTATIIGKEGEEVARIVYRPEKPLPCGAKCWIETQLEVRIDEQ